MRPILKPGLRRLWRDTDTLQLGSDPERAVVLGGLQTADARLLDLLDGSREPSRLLLDAAHAGVEAHRAQRLLDLLDDADVIDDAAMSSATLLDVDEAERQRLAPEMCALALRHPGNGRGAELMQRRRRAVVRVVGAGRVGTCVAALVAAAGVGHVAVEDPTPARAADAVPGGVAAGTAGRRSDAARDAVLRAAPSTSVEPLPHDARADVTVLVGSAARTETPALLATWRPHLVVDVREALVVIGPFVVPGASCCLRCVELTRCDRDPGWPRVAAQLTHDRCETTATDVVLTVAAAAVAAAQVLDAVDGATPSALDGTLELRTGSWRVRRRSWLVHPRCGCDGSVAD